jgi:thiamine biosynthesis lipoprotein ApbE
VLNPLTGQPLDGDDACVTLAANAADSEIFSTALLAMGREGAKRYLAQAIRHDLIAGWFESEFGFTWI